MVHCAAHLDPRVDIWWAGEQGERGSGGGSSGAVTGADDGEGGEGDGDDSSGDVTDAGTRATIAVGDGGGGTGWGDLAPPGWYRAAVADGPSRGRYLVLYTGDNLESHYIIVPTSANKVADSKPFAVHSFIPFSFI